MNSNNLLNRLTLSRTNTSIRLGQVWRTSGGETARIICVDRDHRTHPIIALVGATDDPWAYSREGKVLGAGKGTAGKAHELDLVSLWRDPAVIEGWVNIYQNGTGSFHTTKGEADSWASPNLITSLKVTGMEEVKSYRRRRGLGRASASAAPAAKKTVDHRRPGEVSSSPVNRPIVDTNRKTVHTSRDTSHEAR